MTTTTQDSERIGRTILEQIGGAGRLVAMTGAKHVLLLERGVCFKFAGGRYCEIVLDADDTYTIEVSKLRRYEKTGTRSLSGVYCDGLVETFESMTGLYLTL
jgi:hypothetical protein